MYTAWNSASQLPAATLELSCSSCTKFTPTMRPVSTHHYKKVYSGSGGAVPRTTTRLISVGQVIVVATLLRHRRYGDVPAMFCTDTVMYRYGYVSARFCTGTVMYMHGYVPVRSCTGTVMYRHGYLPVRSCTGTVMYQHCYVPSRLFTGTVMYRHCYVPVCDSSSHHVVRPEGPTAAPTRVTNKAQHPGYSGHTVHVLVRGGTRVIP
jgi:hypothetical protein